MNVIEYKILCGVSNYQVKEEKSLIEFFKAIPYFFSSHYFPSLDVLNNFLSSGSSEHGMSGGVTWTPFQIEKEDYEKLITELKLTFPTLIFDLPPKWVKNYSEWQIWVMKKSYGIPIKENLKLTKKYQSIINKLKKAQQDNNKAEVLKLYLKSIVIGQKLANLHMKKLRKKTK